MPRELDSAEDSGSDLQADKGPVMPDNMTFDEALEQLRRVAKRHEGMKGLLHEIADAMEREYRKLQEEK